MRRAEAQAMASGLSGAAMMEAAGAAAADFIRRQMEPAAVAVMCGPGGNGGDGFVVARLLRDAGWTVRVGLLGERAALKGDAALMASLYHGAIEPAAPAVFDGASLIVDALFGAGLSRPVDDAARQLIEAANAHPAPIIAIDIPSGVNADTGAVMGVAAQAVATVTFGARKPCHLLFPGRALSGRVHIADIGLSDAALGSVGVRLFENHPAVWAGALRRPGFASHKFTRGHAAIVSGPRHRTGAARLAAMSALRAGAGLVTMVAPSDAADENAAHLTAVMLRVADDADTVAALLADRRYTAALIGPATGVGVSTAQKTLAILASGARAVLDADALSSFEAEPARLFSALRPDHVLTPHEGEFSRLFKEISEDSSGRAERARAASRAAGAVVVLKGADTVIAAPDGRAAINANAPADLATAGSGDVLAGLVAGLLAQGMPAFEAAAAGVWLHGAAGAVAGPGLIAEDLPNVMPQVWRMLLTPPKSAEPPKGDSEALS